MSKKKILYETGDTQKEKLQAIGYVLGAKLGLSKPFSFSNTLDVLVKEKFEALLEDEEARKLIEEWDSKNGEA